MHDSLERDPVGAWPSGDTLDAQIFVRARQSEVLSVAYLLTTGRDRARGLAIAAFLKFFEDAETLDPDADPRMVLLVYVGRCFLRGEYEAEPARPLVMFNEPATQKYGVESRRARTLAALGRLDERERVALVLSEVGGFEPEDLNRVIERGNTLLVAPMETGRQRIRQSLDIPSGQPVRPALLETGFDGPRDDLWTHLEEPVAEIRNRSRRRNRLLTYGAAAGVALLAVVLLLVLAGDTLFGSDDDTSGLVEVTPAPAIDEEPDFAPPVPALPTPTPIPTPLPAGDVPSTLLAEIRHEPESGTPYSTLAVYNAERNELESLPTEDGQIPSTLSDSTGISPDGTRIVMLRGEWLEQSVRYTATAFATGTLEREWHVEVGTYDVIPGGGISVRMGMTLTTERVYLAILGQDVPDAAQVIALDPVTGEPRETTRIDVAPVRINADFRGNVFLFAPPDESRLILAIETSDRLGGSDTDAFLHTLRLPDLAPQGDVVQPHTGTGGVFPLWGARMSPDGSSLYTLTSIDERWPARLIFFNLDSSEPSLVDLPFRNDHALTYPILSTVLSNNGHRLYVIDRMSGDVAIVHLIEQRLERMFPIDAGEFGPRFGIEADQFVFGWDNALSSDGTRLYLTTGIGDQNRMRDLPRSSGVWVIDLQEWKIVDFWPVEGGTSEVFASADGQSVLVRHWHNDSREESQYSYRLTRLGGGPGQPVGTAGLDEPANYTLMSLAKLYRAQHGRTPAVDDNLPADLDQFTTLPRMTVSTGPDPVAGISTTIEVQLLEPASDETLETQPPNVRFNPESTISAYLRGTGQSDQFVVLAQVETGVYRASTTFSAPGDWTIDVAVTAPDGTASLAPHVTALTIAPALAGTDGKLYQFNLDTLPEEPVTRGQTMVRVWLMDVESGRPMPDGVQLAVGQPGLGQDLEQGMPGRIDVALTGPGSGGYRTVLLQQVTPTAYEGTVALRNAGEWRATIRFQLPDGERISIPGGVIQVSPSS